MSSDDYSTDEDRHNHYTTERKTPQLSTPLASTADRLSPLPHPASKRTTPSRTPLAAPASPPYLYSSSDTETTDTDDADSLSSYSASSLSPASSTLHTPRQHSPSLLYDRPAVLVNEATPLLPPLTATSSLRSVFTASHVDADVEGDGGGELVRFMVGVDMELSVFVLRVVCVVLASVAIVSVSAEFTTLHVLLTAPVVIFALAVFFNANSSSQLLRHVSRKNTHSCTDSSATHRAWPVCVTCVCPHSAVLCYAVMRCFCEQLLIACTVLCVLELANMLVAVLFLSLDLAHLWYDVAVSITLFVASCSCSTTSALETASPAATSASTPPTSTDERRRRGTRRRVAAGGVRPASGEAAV